MWSKRIQLEDLRGSQTTGVGGALDVDISKQMSTDLFYVTVKDLLSRFYPPKKPLSHVHINKTCH